MHSATEVLELWHPDGRADDEAGLLVVAPGDDQATANSICEAIASAEARLAEDGVLWVIVGRRRRALAEKCLRRSGLQLRERVLTLPPWPASEHLLPLDADVLADAATRHMNMRRVRARAVWAIARTAVGRHALARFAPGCALVASRSGSRRLHNWLAELDPAAGDVVPAVVCSNRPDAAVATIMRFRQGSGKPDLVVKRGLDDPGDERVRREREALATLGGSAVRAGFAVPPVLSAADDKLLVTGALAGQSAARSLAQRPDRLSPVGAAVADRLLAFAHATKTTIPAPRTLLEATLIQPAMRITRGRPATQGYVDALRGLADRIEREGALVTCAVHGDLTMSNVLVAQDVLALIDWESATPAGLPLSDLWYALADAVTYATGVSHVHAVEMLVTGVGSVSPLHELPARHAASLGLSPDHALLGFHACWLQHAADEIDRGAEGAFVEVVAAIAQARLLCPEPS
jgi:aminoglycoside phosphotransferase (APT) family kinase protein